jgi:hypothetical protein
MTTSTGDTNSDGTVNIYDLSALASQWGQTVSPTPTPTPTKTPGSLNLNPPDGYTYNGAGVTSTSSTLTLHNNTTITGVHFTGGGLGLQITGSGNTIRNCTFDAYSWAALILWVGNDNIIENNTFNGVAGSGANIQVIGGKRNQIINNEIHGGITAIIFLYSRSSNGGGLASIIENNIVSGNTVSGFSEEGISFDVKGDNPNDVATLEYDTIISVNGSSVTLSNHTWPSYVGYDMVFLTGAQSGRTRSIVSQAGNSFTLSSLPAGVTAGDKVVIGATFKNNLVSSNNVTAGGMGILLYGMAFGNRIESNTVVNGGIKVESIDNLEIATGSVTQTYGRAPTGYNTVINNTVTNADVSLEYYAIPTINGHANTYTTYRSYGNNVYGNTASRIVANAQNAYISDNTGDQSLSDVVLSPTEMQ